MKERAILTPIDRTITNNVILKYQQKTNIQLSYDENIPDQISSIRKLITWIYQYSHKLYLKKTQLL